MLLVEKASKSIVLVIRGTSCPADVLRDIKCDAKPFLNGFAHRGILNGAEKVMTEIKGELNEAMKQHPGYKLVITGHSLGAGTAILITMGILENIYGINVDEVKCVALAPPPVYRSEHKIPEKFTKNIKIFVNKNDNCPRFSLANVALVIEQMRAIDKSELGITDCLKIIFGKGDKKKFKNIVESIAKVSQNEIQNQGIVQNFHHPGTVYHLREKTKYDEAITNFKTEGQYFTKSLCISDGFVWDHMQGQYAESFARVKFEDTRSFVIPGLTLLWEILLGLFHFLHSNDSMISVVKYK